MRKYLAPVLFASTLALGACATSPYAGYGNSPYGGYGTYGGAGGLTAVLGTILGASSAGSYGGQSFQQAAVNACGNAASRYGRVAIRDVDAVNRSTLRVYGLVGTNYGSRDFSCYFRSDGRIVDFDL